jgi:hypothetical protein
MRLVLVLAVTAQTLTIATAADAQDYPWCSSFHDGAGTNCGFTSLEQCMATAAGAGGTCEPNNLYRRPAAVVAAPHRPPSHSARKNAQAPIAR